MGGKARLFTLTHTQETRQNKSSLRARRMDGRGGRGVFNGWGAAECRSKCKVKCRAKCRVGAGIRAVATPRASCHPAPAICLLSRNSTCCPLPPAAACCRPLPLPPLAWRPQHARTSSHPRAWAHRGDRKGPRVTEQRRSSAAADRGPAGPRGAASGGGLEGSAKLVHVTRRVPRSRTLAPRTWRTRACAHAHAREASRIGAQGGPGMVRA